MGSLTLTTILAALGTLPEAFEKNPHGAAWVGSLLALAMICFTIVNVHKKQRR